jgi:hypothetical protein
MPHHGVQGKPIAVLDPAQVQRLCAELRRTLQRDLAPALTRSLDDLDASLFALARAARAAQEEQRLLDGLRELRRQRAAVEHGFIARLGQMLGQGTAQDARRSPATPLSLFARDELEERLALAAIAKASSAQLHAALHALNRRVAVLLGVTGCDDQSNPLGPSVIAHGFRDAFLALDVGLDLRLLAYRKLQQHVMAALDESYARCNALLIAAGILPELPIESVLGGSEAPQADGERPAATLAAVAETVVGAPVEEHAAAARPPGSEPAPAAAAAASGDLAGLFRMMLQRRAAQILPPAASLRGLAEAREVPRERLLDATAQLLRDSHAEPGQLKRHLLELAQKQSPARVALSPEDEGTVDLVDTLFERMARDDQLPSPLSRVLKALRVPFLNAALRDQSLLDDPAHPARQLIDEFGDSARGWSATADPGQRLVRQMQSLQSMLRDRCGAEAAGFEEALSEFREFAAAHRMQVEQAELRAIESTRSREALHQAQVDARLTIESHISHFSPSPWLHELLVRHWGSYLVLVMLRYGVVSDHYRQAITFADALLTGERDSGNPIHAASFRARRLELESQLRQGLATLAYSDEDIVRLCGELHTFILVGASHARTVSSPIEDPPSTLEEQPRPESLHPGAMRHLRGLRPGTWFELGAPEQDPERGRLSWVSPLSGRWMLVNWAGRKLVDLPPERMAEDIARGLARVIGDANLLHRAVDSVMNELQPDADGSAEAHAEA